MQIHKTILFGALALLPLVSLGAVAQQDIEGNWSCGPYTMTGKSMTITVTEQRTYGKTGLYDESSKSVITMDTGLTLTTQSSLSGSWSLDQNTIAVQFKSGKFLNSSNSNYSIAMGQRALEEELKKKDWSKSKVLETGNRLVTTPIKPMYKEAQVVVTCTRT